MRYFKINFGSLPRPKNILSYNVITFIMAEVFEARLRKIGNSLGILVPSQIIEELGFHKGDIIHVAIPPAETMKRNKILLELTGIDKKKSSFQREKEDRY